jgi:ketosteroid isomerase-like protein
MRRITIAFTICHSFAACTVESVSRIVARLARGKKIVRHVTAVFALIAAAPIGLFSAVISSSAEELYPQIADASHATPETAKFFTSYFAAKSRHDPKAVMAHFSPDLVGYFDAVLGWDHGGFDGVKKTYETLMPKWAPTGKSYPSEILGGSRSAAVAFTDTPELFGADLRVLGMVDFKEGKVLRWVDYWDGSDLPRALYTQYRTLADKFPADFKEKVVGENASVKLQAIAAQIQKAFAEGDARSAGNLMSYDSTYEDMTLRTLVRGRPAIERYLARALAKTPFGSGSRLRHVVGGDLGGRFEWIGSDHVAGATAISLDAGGAVTSIKVIYDGRLVGEADLRSLAALSLDPPH